MSFVFDIAGAVADEINALGILPEPGTAQRSLLPRAELSELSEMRVSVVPRSVEFERAGRGIVQRDVQVDVGIQKKLATEAEVPGLLDLAEQIIDALRGRSLAGCPQAVWVRTANEPIYAADHLAEQRTFTSVLTLTYRVLQ
jgi:hypothetical protein